MGVWIRHRHSRRPFTRVVLFLQFSLVTLSGFHYHADPSFASRSTPGVTCAAPASPGPASSDWMLCPVCQFMRSGARPAASAAIPQAVTYSFFVLRRMPIYGSSHLPATAYGRAPPAC